MTSTRPSLRRSVSGGAATRERLLDAGERLFAARGFSATAVRRITEEAHCNLAAVNYHFGGKAGLYREVFGRRLRALREMRIRSIQEALRQAGPRADIETLLRVFTTAFLEPHRKGDDGRMLMKLFTREMADPHLEPGTVRKAIVQPVQNAMADAFAELGVPLRGRAARRCVQSLIAQLTHVVQMRALEGERVGAGSGDFGFPQIIDHIVDFSAGGIRACAAPGSRRHA